MGKGNASVKLARWERERERAYALSRITVTPWGGRRRSLPPQLTYCSACNTRSNQVCLLGQTGLGEGLETKQMLRTCHSCCSTFSLLPRGAPLVLLVRLDAPPFSTFAGQCTTSSQLFHLLMSCIRAKPRTDLHPASQARPPDARPAPGQGSLST